jgi:hypothetical protein
LEVIYFPVRAWCEMQRDRKKGRERVDISIRSFPEKEE